MELIHATTNKREESERHLRGPVVMRIGEWWMTL